MAYSSPCNPSLGDYSKRLQRLSGGGCRWSRSTQSQDLFGLDAELLQLRILCRLEMHGSRFVIPSACRARVAHTVIAHCEEEVVGDDRRLLVQLDRSF